MRQELFNTKLITVLISVVLNHKAKIVEHKCIQTRDLWVWRYENAGIIAFALICMVCLTSYYDILALKGIGK